jgi:tRNA 2-thiocytidine biosynthesis protein TtcA
MFPGNLCGQLQNVQRQRMRRLLDELQKEIPNVRHSILSALDKLHRPQTEVLLERKPSLRIL